MPLQPVIEPIDNHFLMCEPLVGLGQIVLPGAEILQIDRLLLIAQ